MKICVCDNCHRPLNDHNPEIRDLTVGSLRVVVEGKEGYCATCLCLGITEIGKKDWRLLARVSNGKYKIGEEA